MLTALPGLKTILDAAAAEIRRSSMASYGSLWTAYIRAGDTLADLTRQGETLPADISENQSIRISITANLIQSVVVPECLISSGFYWAASAVLRQHMEALARIIELRNGSINRGSSPPHVGSLPFRLSRNYGRLSELAHLSRGEFLADFAQMPSQDHVAALASPVFRTEWAKILLSIHLAHLVALVVQIDLLHHELYPTSSLLEVDRPLNEIAETLVSTGFWEREGEAIYSKP
jgi:hypothetical protein